MNHFAGRRFPVDDSMLVSVLESPSAKFSINFLGLGAKTRPLPKYSQGRSILIVNEK